jgi:tryptophan synthase alpha chain
MNPIDELFGRLRTGGKKAFIPFVTAGDPDVATTAEAIRELDSVGCNLIEIGFPFSDPIADGPVIQASYTRALERGLKLDQVFSCIEGLGANSEELTAPLVGMVSFTLIVRRGVPEFLERAKAVGLSGLIVPDLPVEEAADFCRQCADCGLRSIMLVAPTTPIERVRQIVKLSTGFLYCLSVAGITGESDRLPDELIARLKSLRDLTDLPLCVGFGVSRPEHVQMLREHVDGVIVGSAVVRRLEQAERGWPAAQAQLRTLVRALIDALNPV